MPVANPGFPGGNLLFGQIFPEICMKMKEIAPRGGAKDARLLDPLMDASDKQKESNEAPDM